MAFERALLKSDGPISGFAKMATQSTFMTFISGAKMKRNELLDSLWNLHKQISAYDIHYSNVRLTLLPFLITVSGYAGYITIGKNSFLALLPALFLFFIVFLSNWLVNAMDECWTQMTSLEHLIGVIVQDDNQTVTSSSKEISDAFKFTEKKNKRLNLGDMCKTSRNLKFYWLEIGNMLFFIIAVMYLIFWFGTVFCQNLTPVSGL